MKNQFEPNTKLPIPEIPVFDHKEAVDDDCGLPENPIYANYPKYLWRRTNTGFHPNKSDEKTHKSNIQSA
jgi:hypothetical protein